jgi:hypothetical protein
MKLDGCNLILINLAFAGVRRNYHQQFTDPALHSHLHLLLLLFHAYFKHMTRNIKLVHSIIINRQVYPKFQHLQEPRPYRETEVAPHQRCLQVYLTK